MKYWYLQHLEPENVILGKIIQTEKLKNHTISLMHGKYNLGKQQMDQQEKQTNTCGDRHQCDGYPRGGGGGGHTINIQTMYYRTVHLQPV